jgi:hypothetical protein
MPAQLQKPTLSEPPFRICRGCYWWCAGRCCNGVNEIRKPESDAYCAFMVPENLYEAGEQPMAFSSPDGAAYANAAILYPSQGSRHRFI